MSKSILQTKENNFLDALPWKDKIGFECYGAKINFRCDDTEIKKSLRELLPSVVKINNFESSNSKIVSLRVKRGAAAAGLYFNEELIMEISDYDPASLEFVADKIIMILALASLPEKFYLHAGAVVWDGAGILIPGESFAGKTTLVKEFIKAGAEYFSDDCIILDDEGYLLPFSRALAIRTEQGRVFHNADYFGAKTGDRKAKLDLVIFTGFEKDAVWNPSPVSRGQAVLELMNNFYYKGSIPEMPGEVIKALTRVTEKVRLASGKRGEAAEVVGWATEFYKGKNL